MEVGVEMVVVGIEISRGGAMVEGGGEGGMAVWWLIGGGGW